MFKPMLASPVDESKLKFPALASAKLDGIRAIVRGGVVMSRSWKPIPSKFVQEKFSHLEHFDGELIVGEPTDPNCYRNTTSHVMAHDKRDFDVKFFAFDHVESLTDCFTKRVARLPTTCGDIVRHTQHGVDSLEELVTLESHMLRLGYEGLILRDPESPYKCGRSTAREGYLLKLKRFVDDEATVVDFVERMHNGNEATTDELGRTKRSTHAANKSGLGDLGALSAVTRDGVAVSIGSGFTAAEREEIWNNRKSYVGKLVKFKHFPIGAKDKPRHPIFLGWRDRIDL